MCLQKLNKIFILCTLPALFLIHNTSIALTISSAPTQGVTNTTDTPTRTTTFTAVTSSANLNSAEIVSALATNNVKIADAASEDITVANSSLIEWGSPYSLVINAPRNILIQNSALFISRGFGNIVLRSDTSGDNNGTIIPQTNATAIFMNGGASVKIYYRVNSFTQPNDYSNLVRTVAPGKMTAYMLINDFNDLQNMSANVTGKYALATNIDGTQGEFSPIATATTPFNGEFDGQGYSVTDLSIQLPNFDYVGLFAALGSNSTIENLLLLNVHIQGRHRVGGLAGQLSASAARAYVTNVYVLGSVAGNDYVGSILGYSTGSASILDQVYSAGFVRGTRYVGGIAGDGGNALLNCYSLSHMTINAGGMGAGGLLGYGNSSAIQNSYAAGSVPIVSNSGGIVGTGATSPTFYSVVWDRQATGQVNPGGNAPTLPGTIGLTTEQMRQRAYFPNWNFNTVWAINENFGYPYLRWTQRTAPWSLFPNGITGVKEIVG